MEAINTAQEWDDVGPFVELLEEHTRRLKNQM
jgi:hypothetical protein